MTNLVTEQDYRGVKLDSSSSLKDFSIDRKKYYRKYILFDEIKEKETQALAMGQLVETLLWEPELFDTYFYMSACVTTPPALMLEFIEALYRHSVKNMDENNEVNATFEELSKAAYDESSYKLKYDAVIKKFAESDAIVYFEEICNVRQKNLLVVNSQDVNNAEKIVLELQENLITRHLVTVQTNTRYTVYDQLKIAGYEVNGILFKSMLDRVIVDHNEKTIQPLDLKCTWTVEDFYKGYYLKRRSYFQAFLYYHACLHFQKMNPELAKYEVKFIKFIVCDSINYFSPLIFELGQEDMKDASQGFTAYNRAYPGFAEVTDNLKWAKMNDIWNISKRAHDADGILNIKYDYR